MSGPGVTDEQAMLYAAVELIARQFKTLCAIERACAAEEAFIEKRLGPSEVEAACLTTGEIRKLLTGETL